MKVSSFLSQLRRLYRLATTVSIIRPSRFGLILASFVRDCLHDWDKPLDTTIFVNKCDLRITMWCGT